MVALAWIPSVILVLWLLCHLLAFLILLQVPVPLVALKHPGRLAAWTLLRHRWPRRQPRLVRPVSLPLLMQFLPFPVLTFPTFPQRRQGGALGSGPRFPLRASPHLLAARQTR